MENIKNLTMELDTEMNRIYSEYVDLHEELNQYRGKPIGDTNLDEVNRLLKEIQDKFAQLYPVYSFIISRNEYATNAINSYNEFIDLIKKAGAQQDEKTA